MTQRLKLVIINFFLLLDIDYFFIVYTMCHWWREMTKNTHTKKTVLGMGGQMLI